MTKELVKAPESLSVWESNMKELRTRQPLLAGVLDEYVKENGHAFAHFETVTPAGRWIEGLTDEPFFEADKEPEFGWNRKKKEDRDKPVFFQYGIGVPPYLFKSIRALPDAALSLIVVEPSIPLLAYTLHLTHVYLALPQQCRIFFLTELKAPLDVLVKSDEQPEQNTLPDLVLPEAGSGVSSERSLTLFMQNKNLMNEALSTALTYIGIYAAQLSLTSWNAGEAEIMREAFIRLSSEVREWVSTSLSYLGNSAEDTLLGVRQQVLLSHYSVFGSKLDPLLDKFEGYPAISVAAGPSLDKNFHLLKDIQDKCVIIASDAVLEKLLSNGIRPHIVTSLERVVLTYQLFFSEVVDKYRDECKEILLVAQSVTVPWTSCRWPGPVCVVGKKGLPSDEWLVGSIYNGSIMLSGSSVAHMNFVLSKIMGTSAVAAIGQDLAYAESGESHAGAVGASWNYKNTNNRRDTIQIPGALGGTVTSYDIWLSFLRALEIIIHNLELNAWDCTEGGAKIEGTKIVPLADFISEHVEGLAKMPKTPAELVREVKSDIDRRQIAEDVIGRIEKQFDIFNANEAVLKDVETLVERACAPGLEPKRRVALASEAGVKLDELHGKNIIIDFIGQSYTRLASIELSLTRSMDSVENVKRWEEMHEDIIASHRAIIAMLRRWLTYGIDVMNYYAVTDDTFRPLSADEAWDKLCELLPQLESAKGDEIRTLRVAINDLINRCDPIILKWPGHVLWTLGMLLMDEGRAALAARFMNGAQNDFDGKEMMTDEIVAFLKDFAMVLTAHDLTITPDTEKAEIVLSNAIELGGIDDEVKKILLDILDTESALQGAMDSSFGGKRAGWYIDRAAAQRAIYDGKLDRALVLIWRAIQKHWKDVTGWAASHLDWLAKTLEDCRFAESPILAATVETLIDEMAEADEVLNGVPITYRSSFIEILKERGLKVSLMEKEIEPVEDTSEDAELSDEAKHAVSPSEVGE